MTIALLGPALQMLGRLHDIVENRLGRRVRCLHVLDLKAAIGYGLGQHAEELAGAPDLKHQFLTALQLDGLHARRCNQLDRQFPGPVG